MLKPLLLECEVGPGQFNFEYSLTLPSTKIPYSMFLSRNLVFGLNDKKTKGCIRVRLMEENENECLVLLPKPSIEGPRLVVVPRSSTRDYSSAS